MRAKRPPSTLALKNAAHAAFDRIWRHGLLERSKAYMALGIAWDKVPFHFADIKSREELRELQRVCDRAYHRLRKGHQQPFERINHFNKLGKMTVYLLHFSEPIGRPQSPTSREQNGLPPREGEYKAHAQHYIGYTTNLEERLKEHRAGWGAHLCRVAVNQGIEIKLARVWEGKGREWEKYLKGRHCSPRLCPICSGEGALSWAKGEDGE